MDLKERGGVMHPVRKYLAIWLPPVIVLTAVLACWLCRPMTDRLLGLYHCPIHALTGLLCPGCGGTRSLKALLQGKLLFAVHENPAAVLLAAAALLRYLEVILKACGKPMQILPRNLWFWYIPIGLILVWAVLRNFIPALMPMT